MEVIMHKTLAVMVLLALAPLTTAAKPISLVEEWNPNGEPPDGCVAALTGGGVPSRWVVARATDEGGERAVTEITRDRTAYRFPLCILEGRSLSQLADLDVSIRFRPVDGKVDQAAGIAVRVRDPKNYYVVRANALEGNVRLYLVINGDRQEFAGVSRKIERGQWHTLRLRVEGEQFAVSYDGQKLFDAKDDRLREPGKIALWTKADSLTEFSSVDVEPLR
jgi:hypothetical protein